MNKSLITKIMASVPKGVKPRDYLMKKLDISKESAYRRMHSKIPFSW
jgi:hypothetical protein